MVEQPEFDVFLAHNSQDKLQVMAIANQLKQRGLKPWIDEEQILPGRPFQEIIQQAILNVKSAAIFIGQSGLGKWQILELRSLIGQFVDSDIPVIPVLLPGLEEIPRDLLFLKQFHWVSLTNDIHDAEALKKLVSGITQRHPKSSPKTSEHFDVLLCYSDEDQLEVRQIGEQLKERQIRSWLDLWEVPPGQVWQDLLADKIAQIKSVAIFIGNNRGPWQREEIESFIWEFIELGRPVIPVILQTVEQEPEPPIYLRRRLRGARVDFRQDHSEALYNLEWGITQKKPDKIASILDKGSSRQKTSSYAQLEELLAAGKWQEADQETKKILLEASGKQQDERIGVEEIRNLARESLYTINELWVRYSNGHFGFSVQQRIWTEVCSKPMWKKIVNILGRNDQGNNNDNKAHWYRFGETVGWYKENKLREKQWVQYKDITFNLEAPEGHLPYCREWWKGMRYQYEPGRFSTLMLRIKDYQK